MVRKINYMRHVLNVVCTYMRWNGASRREITDAVEKKLRGRGGQEATAEIRKALSTGVKNEILSTQNGKYKLNFNTIGKKFRDHDIKNVNDKKRHHDLSLIHI